MKKFANLDEYSDDELIILVYQDKGNWQEEAVAYAKLTLTKRGISEEFGKKRIKEIRIEENEFKNQEMEFRKHMSFNVFFLISIGLFWFSYIFSGWFLKKEGYVKMSKQRFYALGAGILFYVTIVLHAIFTADESNELRIQEIDQLAKAESIAISKIDWSGVYVFLDTTMQQNYRTDWRLTVHKHSTSHTANLRLINAYDTLTIECIGLIKKEKFEFYPDTNYVLFDNSIISYYDRLFTFVKDSNGLYTFWDKMSPFFLTDYNSLGLFKADSSTNN